MVANPVWGLYSEGGLWLRQAYFNLVRAEKLKDREDLAYGPVEDIQTFCSIFQKRPLLRLELKILPDFFSRGLSPVEPGLGEIPDLSCRINPKMIFYDPVFLRVSFTKN